MLSTEKNSSLATWNVITGVDLLQMARDVMDNLREGTDQDAILLSFSHLLNFLKNDEKFFITVYDNVYDSIGKHIYSENPDIVKASIITYHDVIQINWLNENISDWMPSIVSNLLNIKIEGFNSLDDETKSILDKSISDLAKCYYEETMITLLSEILYKPMGNITNLACDVLLNLLKYNDKNIMINCYDWNEIIRLLLEIYSQKGDKLLIAVNILTFMKSDLFEDQQFIEILTKIDDDYLTTLILIIKFKYNEVLVKKKENDDEFRRVTGYSNF
jgi:hypothetical protein